MNKSHLEMLQRGVASWNGWRDKHPDLIPDLESANVRNLSLRDANLSSCNLRKLRANGDYKSIGTNFVGANLAGADLRGAQLRGAILRHARFNNANLSDAKLANTDIYCASFKNAIMQRVDLWGASVNESDLSGVDLTEARLRGTLLIRCNLSNTDLSGSVVYGSSVWDLRLTDSVQENLVITPDSENQQWQGSSAANSLQAPTITVDNLEVAQFMYLVLNNSQIRQAIDTIGKKTVLILGRFTTARKQILDGLRRGLRNHDLLPIMFDFEKPSSRSFIETLSLLAHMS